MKREKLFLIVIVILALGLGLAWSAILKMKDENETALRKAQRADDYREIQNVFAKHSYYYAAQEQWLELETAWSKKSDMNKIVQMYEMYGPTRVPQNVPRLPEPYETWEDTTPYIK